MMQISSTECGLVAAAMIMRSLGGGASLATLRQRYDPGRDGMSIIQMRDLFRAFGFRTRVLRVEGGGYATVPTPFVAYWENAHYVVVDRVRPRSVTVVDPAVGRRTVTRAEFERSLSGLVISAEMFGDRGSTEPERSPWRVIVPFLRRRPGLVTALLLMAVVTAATTLAMPYVASRTIGDVIDPRRSAAQPFALLVGVLLGFAVTGMVGAFVSIVSAISLGRDISMATFGRLLALPYKYFTQRSRGDLLFRLHATQQLEELLTTDLARGVSGSILVLTAGTAMVALNVELGVVSLLVFAVLLAVLAAAKRVTTRWSDSELHHESLANAVQVDSVSTISLVKSTGFEDDAFTGWAQENDRALAWRRRRSLLDGAVQTTVGFVQSFAPLMLAVAAMSGLGARALPVADALAFQILASAFFAQASVIGHLATRIGQGTAVVRRLEDILSAEPDDTFVHGVCHTVSGDIEVKGLTFTYSALSRPVLKNVSLTVARGSKVAIVGPSGSGKSTLAKVIAGLHQPQAGVVEFGGRPIGEHTKSAFRSHVAYVEQEAPLRNATILDNIAWGRPGVGEDRVVDAARRAAIHDDIVQMPMAYRTFVAQNGENLSGGQRQRIAVARALVGAPDVIILDESTSALDRTSERQVMASLGGSDATRVVIAHRLETIQDADCIHVMDDGRVIDSGTHDELIDRCELYAQLYRKERGDLMQITDGVGR